MFFLPVYHSNGWLISLFCQPAHLFNFLKYFLHSQLYSFAFHLIYAAAAAAAKSLQSCPTLCDPIDGSSPGSPIPGILQARTLEWVAISFSNAWKWKVKVKSLSCVQLLATPWTAAHQAPPSMGFSRQEYWSGVPSPSPQLTHSHWKKKLKGMAPHSSIFSWEILDRGAWRATNHVIAKRGASQSN